MLKKRPFSKLITATLLGALITGVVYIQHATAHGSLTGPPSRIYNCFAEGATMPSSLACQWVLQTSGTQQFYDWHEVNLLADGQHRELIPDGQLCSAGKEKYAGLDLARDDWPTTIIEDGTTSIDFDYWAWAPHSTDYMAFYLTKDGYDPLEPLKWADLEDEPFCTITDPELSDESFYHMNCAVPDKSGPHVIYNIWQRDDSPEAFYTCSDVFFTDENNPPPVVEVPVAGQCNAHPWFSAMVYLSGDFIVHNGKEWRAQWWTSGDVPGQAGVWVEVTTCDGTVDPATPVPTAVPTAEPTPVPTPIPTIEPTPVPNDDALLRLPDVTAATGEAVTVMLDARALDALGSATIVIAYDGDVVSPESCDADPDAQFSLAHCSISTMAERVSLSLVSNNGVSGDAALAALTFTAVGADMDVSELQISAETFTNTIGESIAVATDPGSITIGNALLGDVNCDQAANVIDALFILQYTVGARAAGGTCPPTGNTFYLPHCDVDSSGSCDVVDGLFVLQCTVGLTNPFCPADGELLNRAAASRFVEEAALNLALVNQGEQVVGTISAEIPTSSAASATTLNLSYDKRTVSVASCELAEGLTGVCNTIYQDNAVAISIIAADGYAGDLEIASVTFDALADGASTFTVDAVLHSDGNGVALPISSAEQSAQISTIPTAIHFDNVSSRASTTLQLVLLGLTLLSACVMLVYVRRAPSD